jgi:hypothetical protein
VNPGGRPRGRRGIGRPEGRHGTGRPKGRHYVLAVGLLLLGARDALACPICFGASDAPLAVGMNWGVLTLLGVTLGVLGSFAALFVKVVRKSERELGPADRLRSSSFGESAVALAKAEAGPYRWPEGAEAGPHTWPEPGDLA